MNEPTKKTIAPTRVLRKSRRSNSNSNTSTASRATASMGNVQVRQDKVIEGTKNTGQTCSKKDSVLKTATVKVGEKNLKNLPESRSDPDWKELKEAKGLDIDEVLALKKFACTTGLSRGMLPSTTDDGTVYKVSDKRVRCSFTISLFDGSIVMPADLMIDSGAECELRLPGRKVVQLGLQPAGEPVRTKGAIPGRGLVSKFYPPVWVSATLIREGLNGERVKEEVKELLSVSALHSDYQQALQSHQDADDTTSQNVLNTPEATSPPWFRNDTTPTPTTPAARAHIEVVKLTPVRHRPLDNPDEQAFIGFAGLQKLRMHVNAQKRQLEIEEETFIEA